MVRVTRDMRCLLAEPPVDAQHDEDPGGDHDHAQVVADHEPADAERFTVPHEPRPDHFHEGHIGEAEEESGDWAADQRPVVDTRVCDSGGISMSSPEQ